MDFPNQIALVASPAAAARAMPRTLIVDDDPAILVMEALILERAGHRVDRAQDGETAWQALLQRNYDLLLTDNQMPGTSGVALVRQLRVANMELPVVMISGTLGDIDTQRLSHDPWARIDAFLQKPFTVQQLLATVQLALGRLNGGPPPDLARPD